ncbi:MAG: antitoxin [Campylobacterota bacterium]|nr:antitoxin [Campylobacterota bacterium]
MKNNELYTKEELELFEQIEAGNYTPIAKEKLEKEKVLAQQIAQNTIQKMTRKKSLNLRVFESDIKNIKALALEKGLPYQTLIASIIHQVATKQIKV